MYLTDFVNFFFSFNKLGFGKYTYTFCQDLPLMLNLVAFRGNLICILRLCSTQQIAATLGPSAGWPYGPWGQIFDSLWSSLPCFSIPGGSQILYVLTLSSYFKIKSHCKQWTISAFTRAGKLFFSLLPIPSGLTLFLPEVCWGRSKYYDD